MELVTLDLGFMRVPKLAASYLVPTGDGGFALFETGPARTLGRLRREAARAGYALRDLRAVFLTHIHLDHAGGAGELAQRTGATVYVHPAGAPHIRDPEAKLVPSAKRLYGWRLRFVWGVMRPAPAERVVEVEHGQVVRVGELEVTAWHTPGHARHHVAWQIGRAVVTGDVAGVRLPGSDHVLPPTPPPDIDLDRWTASIDLIRKLDPELLLLTHYGAASDVGRLLDQLEGRLLRWRETAEQVVAAGGTVEELAERLTRLDNREMAASGTPRRLARRYRMLCPMTDNAAGLFRYVTRRATAAPD